MQSILEQYGGWLGFALYFLYKEVWPLLSHKIIPARLKDLEEQRTLRVSELKEEREFHNMIEKERLQSQQEMTKAIQTFAQTIAENSITTSEKLVHILANQSLILSRQDTMAAVLNEGIADMRAATGVSSKGAK